MRIYVSTRKIFYIRNFELKNILWKMIINFIHVQNLFAYSLQRNLSKMESLGTEIKYRLRQVFSLDRSQSTKNFFD